MLLVILALLMLSFSLAQQASPPPLNCTLTQTGWRRGTWINLPLMPLLCGLDPMQLLYVDAARLYQPQNALWVAAAHQHCAASLNVWSVASHCNTSDVTHAMLLLGDSLERVCDSVDQWTLEPSLNNALQLLMQFNQGFVEGCDACLNDSGDGGNSTTTSNTTTTGPAFYYYQAPDVVTLRLLDSNQTLTYSLLKGQYNTTLALTLFSLASILVIVILTLAVVILNNRNRRYILQRTQHAGDSEIEMREEDLSHLDRENEATTTMSDVDLASSLTVKDKDI